MNEEKMTVLRMLAEGKINAEEAARLLEALGEEAPQEKAGEGWSFPFEAMSRGARRFMRQAARGRFHGPWGDWIYQGDPFQEGFDTTPQSVTAQEGMTLQVHSNMGAIRLVGTEDPQIVVEGSPRRHYRIEEHDNIVTVHASRMGAQLTVRVPTLVDKVIVHSNLGEIDAEKLNNDEVQLSTNTGEIEYAAGAIKAGAVRLRSDVGEIVVRMSREAAAEIRATCEGVGEVSFDSDAPLEALERGAGFLHGKLNGGGADIRAITHMGEIRFEVEE